MMSPRIIIFKYIVFLIFFTSIPENIRCQNAEYNPFANPEDSKGAPLVDNDDLDIVRVYAQILDIKILGEKSYPAKSKAAGKYLRWDKDDVYIAPAWFGIKRGNQITRLGFSWCGFQDATQNVVHKLMYKTGTGCAKYYLGYISTYKGFYAYRGFLNSRIIWNR